jgi:hypothetical protein
MFAVLSTRAFRKRFEYMAFRANQQLREDIWDYRYKSSAGESESENVLSFNPSTAKDYGA